MIYVITHKKYCFPELDDEYKVLLVGAENKMELKQYIRDDSGNNISEKNPFFCELTGLYWIWKNTSDDIVGICHYRRYFTYRKEILKSNELDKIFQKYDIILPKKIKFAGTVYQDYKYSEQHNIQDMDMLIQLIDKRYPQYSESLHKVLNNKFFYPFNMMIMKRKYYDKYCEWLFDVLFQLEKIIPYKDYSGAKQRVFGYLSERLMLVWIDYNIDRKKIKELKVINLEGSESISFKIKRRVNMFLTYHFNIDLRKK